MRKTLKKLPPLSTLLFILFLFIFIAVKTSFLNTPRTQKPPVHHIENFKALDSHGQEQSFHSLQKELTLVSFGASWCPACLKSMPSLEALHQQHKDKNFGIIYIANEQQLSDLKAFEKRFKPPYPMLWSHSKIQKNFGNPSAIPSYYLLDSKGVILSYSVGLIPKKEIEKALELIDAKESLY